MVRRLFFFNDTATTEIYTLSLHDALPISSPAISGSSACSGSWSWRATCSSSYCRRPSWSRRARSEEHTSELQSRLHLVCRLLLEKKKSLTGAAHHVVIRDASDGQSLWRGG